MANIFKFLSKDGNITPEKARKSRQMHFRDKTAYVWGIRYRWDPSLSMSPVRQFAHFMPPCLGEYSRAGCSNLQERISQSALSRYTKLMTMKLLRGIIYIFLPQQLFTNSPAVCIAYQALLGIRRFCKPSPPSVRLWRSKRSNLRKQKREESLSLYLF